MYTVDKNLLNTVNDNLTKAFGEAAISMEIVGDMPQLVIAKSKIADVLSFLKDREGFCFLTDLCGVHYPNQEQSFAVVYHLHNFAKNLRIRLKVFASDADIEVPSATSVFSAANWMERETFDFYGIRFVGHPNLTRILNMEDMDYHPMRKEYPLEDDTRTDKDDAMFGR
ncbi:NADH-quinone oxidoreductase subunit C [Alistipes sp. ZOR0009]|jgi:NADH-quinone oxidoreductase subunit C|uniref:NADH-quinone oxidoreductase subunit C n=1 Tax=Alistipes sp. ZOR0009 TaxID=1339253 RepID=UPI000648D2F9|nr:NADH-quinone oxidoreductase subunit C [Alistipes sp. ZOR0009]